MMSMKAKKIIYGSLVFGGAIICLSPFITVAVTGDATYAQKNFFVIPLVIAGLLILTASSIYARKVFFCPSCDKKLLTHEYGETGVRANGVLGIFRVLAMKKCPHCNSDLE